MQHFIKTTWVSILGLTLSSFAMAHEDHTIHMVRADGHAPAGVMFEHMHGKGSLMVGYNAQQLKQNGSYYTGKTKVDISDFDYQSWATQHEMTMHMLHLMYGITDNLTLTVMPMYMKMDMDMHAEENMHHHHHHHMDHAEHHHTGSHDSEGWGDTIIGATTRLYKSQNKKHDVLATLALSAPTGNYKKTFSDGSYQGYGMQLGAGIWQVLPSITYQYNAGDLKAGAQLSARMPLEDTNHLGYYKGQQVGGTAWLSYAWLPQLSTSLRVEYTKTDDVRGQYMNFTAPNSPEFQPINYGGRQALAGFGVNTTIPWGVRVGVEYMIPIYNKVNGIQQETDHVMYLSISKALK